MQEVKSSNISAVDYDELTNILYVKFKAGGKYVYYNVEKRIFDEFLTAKSIGAYFSKNIRNKYKTVKVEDEK